jgi:hypothetical protein
MAGSANQFLRGLAIRTISWHRGRIPKANAMIFYFVTTFLTFYEKMQLE